MADNQGKRPFQGFAQPITELLHGAALFGGDFERQFKLSHLTECVDNIAALRINVGLCARLVRKLSDRKDAPTKKEAKLAIAWLREIEENLGQSLDNASNALKSAEENIVREYQRTKGAPND